MTGPERRAKTSSVTERGPSVEPLGARDELGQLKTERLFALKRDYAARKAAATRAVKANSVRPETETQKRETDR